MTVELLGDVEVLADAEQRLGDVVDHEAGDEEDLEDGEHHRQVLHQLGLVGRHRRADRGTRGNHLLLGEVEQTEDDHQVA